MDQSVRRTGRRRLHGANRLAGETDSLCNAVACSARNRERDSRRSMAILIGVDEAGLGPNLGPYVVTATVWQVPGKRSDFDLWQALVEVVTNAPEIGDARLHIADSKAVFQPGKGLSTLERGVLTALRLCCE